MRNLSLVLFFFATFVTAQNKQLLYGFTEIPQSTLVNPSTDLDNGFYIGIPLLSHLHVQGGSTGVNTFDLFADDGNTFNNRIRQVIDRIDENDYAYVNQQLELFSGGFSFGNTIERENYISFGIYQETDAIAYIPKDYLDLVLEGNSGNIGRPFNLDHLRVRGELLSVFHIGISKKINEKTRIGARFKIYSSAADISSINNSGTFTTREGQNNLLQHNFDLDLQVNSSGLLSLQEEYEENGNLSNSISTIRNNLFLGGNLGLGVDVGFTHELSDQITIDGSMLDLGFISHTKDVDSYAINGQYEYEGFNPLFPEVASGQTAQQYWDDVADEFEELFEVDSTRTSYTTLRPLKLNAAVRYGFGKEKDDCDCGRYASPYKNDVGVQLFAVKRPLHFQSAITAYYRRRFSDHLSAKITYTVDEFSSTNIGVGFSSQIGPVNFYLLADHLLEYRNLANAHAASVQLGFNLVFDKPYVTR